MIQQFFGHVCRPRSTPMAPIPVLAGSVHAQTNKTSSCFCVGNSFTVGQARCDNVCMHDAGPWLKNTEPTTVKCHNGFDFFQVYITKPSSTSTRRLTESVYPQQRSGHVPKTSCRWYCQAHPPTDEGTEKQEKICSRCCGISSSNYECGTRKHTTHSSTCTKGSRVKPTQAERTATLTLASCILLLLLLQLLRCRRKSAVDVVRHQ